MEVDVKTRMRTMMATAFALFCGAGVAMGQYTGPAVTTTSPVASAPAAAMHIEAAQTAILPGDSLIILTYGAPELSSGGMGGVGTLRVSADGTVVLPYLGTVKLAGMTAPEASEYLDKQLKAGGILVDPQVTVQVASSSEQGITVVGEVTRPQPVPVYGAQLRLLDVISACGGFTPFASHTITVHRRGDPQPIVVNLGVDPRTSDATNIPLVAGDTVVVARVGTAYVVGDVWRPDAIPLSSNAPITVVQAISISGGLRYGAALSKAMIIRTTDDKQRVEIVFDLKKVLHGKERDIALTANDILFIPTNGFKAALSSGFATQTSVYAGIGSATLLK
jgi:polysaccharide biosynthesis/export protein